MYKRNHCSNSIYFITILDNIFNIIVSQKQTLIFLKKYLYAIFETLSLCPPLQQKGGQIETQLNTCIAHSNSADLLLFNNVSDWLSEDFDNKS